MANELKGTLFDCLTEKEKARCKRKGVRQRTHPACKSYKAKAEAEQKLKEMRG